MEAARADDLVARHNAMTKAPVRDRLLGTIPTLLTTDHSITTRYRLLAYSRWRCLLQVRDQLLGTDQGGRSYWLLTCDPARLWVQARCLVITPTGAP